MITLSKKDKEFIEHLAWMLAMTHGTRAMRVSPARRALAADIAAAIVVCCETKLNVASRRR